MALSTLATGREDEGGCGERQGWGDWNRLASREISEMNSRLLLRRKTYLKSKLMQECEAVAEDLPIRQGDIFLSHPQGSEPGQLLVAITADCDFAQGKVGSNSVALPIISSQDYALHQWKAVKIGALTRKLVAKRALLIARAASQKLSFCSNVDEQTVNAWFREKEATDIFAELEIEDAAKSELESVVNAIGEMDDLTQSKGELSACIRKYYDVVEKSDVGISLPKIANRPRELEALLSEDRLDYFYLNDVSGVEGSGWYVDLRDVRLIPVKLLVSVRQDWMIREEAYFRTGRMKDLYKYALTQKFGAFFSRIGLPAVHEQWKPQVIGKVSLVAFNERQAGE